MDKQNRITRWQEWKIGGIYEWVKGSLIIKNYVLSEINEKDGYVKLNDVKTWSWRNRYRNQQP